MPEVRTNGGRSFGRMVTGILKEWRPVFPMNITLSFGQTAEVTDKWWSGFLDKPSDEPLAGSEFQMNCHIGWSLDELLVEVSVEP